MGIGDPFRFIKHTEQSVSPKAVGRLYGRAEMLSKLPLAIQKWIVGRAGGDSPDVGFIVEPYSIFLAYEITDEAAATAQLPPGYELLPTVMFEGGEPRPCAVVGVFNVHTSVFWGSRVELSLIAQNTTTGLLSWIICDYESNTISYDPGQGFSASSTSRSVVTSSHTGHVIIDVVSANGSNRIACVANLDAASMRALDQRLWLEGNLSVDYGGRLLDPGSVPFGLVFEPGEVARAWQLPLDAVQIDDNTFGDGMLAAAPFEVCCFPYAQHYLTTSFPQASPITDRQGLEQAVERVIASRR